MSRDLLVEFETNADDGDPGGSITSDEPPEGIRAESTQDGASAEESVPSAEFKKVQNEAKGLRKRLRDLESQVASKDDEGKSEVEQAVTKLAETSEKLSAMETRNRELLVAVRAPKQGIVDGEVAARLIDFDAIDDPSDVDEIDAALKALVKKHPFLTGKVAGGADGGAGTGTRQAGAFDMNAELRRAAGRT